MKKALWSLLALAASPAWAGYQYYVNDSLQSINPLTWGSSGQLSAGASGLAASAASGGSLISHIPIPDGSSEAEVALTISLKASGGVYTAFLQASPDARTGSSASGSYLAFEMQNPQFDAANKNCSANFLLLQSVAGKVSLLAAFSHSCRDGMRMRMAVHGGTVLIWPDQPAAMEFYIAASAAGQPGLGAYGMPSGNSISLVQLGAIDRTPPSAVDAGKLTASVFRTRVELKWAAAADGPAGIGVAGYWVYRDGLYLGRTSNTYLNDQTVKAGETHSYSVLALDGHFNFAPPAAISVTIPNEELTPITTTPPATPPPGAPGTAAASAADFGRPVAHQVTVGTPQADSGGGLDPRRIGVRALGSYWGGSGENIDAVSGNVNLTIPLLNPTGRNGITTPIALSYNSQIWRKDANGVTLLGQDTGFGLGWKLQAGAITPVWTTSGTIDHYLFSDSTGAECSLSVNTGNVWTSQEGVYVSFDANADKLYFPDGRYWWMGSVSSAGEADAGTMYPANFFDTNGNTMYLVYAPGIGSGSYYTSARLIYIYDARLGTGPAYIFAYNGDAIPHLVAEQGVVAAAESYNFTYLENQPLYEPFTGTYQTSAALLQTATTWMGPSSTFAYVSSYGELQQYTTPLGGNLQWQYRTFTYPSGIALREVQTRYLQSSASDSWHAYNFYHDDSCCSLHTWSAILDNDAKAFKYWQFVTSGTGYALESGYWELHPTTNPPVVGQWTTLLWRATGWSTGNGNLYASATDTAVCDVADTNCQWADTTQVLDSYGNLTTKYVYNYANSTNWTLQYTLTYLTDPNYTSRNIRNRLTSAVVLRNGYWYSLAQNTYDQYSTSCGGQSGLVARNGVVAHDDTDYGPGFRYRGNVTSSTSPAGYTAMQYESTGVAVCTQNGAGLAVTAAPSSSTNYSLPGVVTPNSNNTLSSTVSYNSMWAATSVVNPNGATGTTTYDTWGRPSQSTIPDGAQTNYAYTYYLSLNQQTATVSTGAGRWKRTTLDGFGRVTKVESGTGATTSTPVSQVDTQYAPSGCSPIGQVYRMSTPYAGGGSPTAWTTYAYDERGRTTAVTAPDGSVTQKIYIANMVQIWDAAMKWKTQTFDALGNLSNVTEPDTPNNFTNSTTYTYDGLNNLASVTSQTSSGTQTRTFTYSGIDLTRETNPENGTVNYTYDGAHHVLTKTDAIGQQTQYSYDGYGRLTAKYCYPLVSGSPTLDPNQTVLYYYDTNPHEPSFSTNSQGRLTAVQMNTNQWYEYNYTVPGRVQNQRLQVAGHDYDASYSWDTEGRLSTQSWPSAVSPSTGPQYTFQYDSMGRVGSMLDASNNTQATASYGVANELLGLTYFGMTETRTYNNMLQLIHQYVPGGAIDMQYIYTTGQNNGRIAQSIDGYMPETVNYTYDSLNHLSNAAATNGAYSQSYTYDGFGSLKSKSAAGFYPAYSATFNPANNRQNGVAYDANGN